MVVEKQADCSRRKAASLDSLTYDPITMLLEMSQGFDAYHTAMRAAKISPRLGHTQQARRSVAQSVPRQEKRDGK